MRDRTQFSMQEMELIDSISTKVLAVEHVINILDMFGDMTAKQLLEKFLDCAFEAEPDVVGVIVDDATDFLEHAGFIGLREGDYSLMVELRSDSFRLFDVAKWLPLSGVHDGVKVESVIKKMACVLDPTQ